MNKIGLVTVTYVDNYGSHLQSFALQQIIRSLGYETEVIRTEGLSKDISKRRTKYILSRFYDLGEMFSYAKLITKKLAKIVDNDYKKKLLERGKVFKDFANSNYIFSPVAHTWKELSEMCKERYSTVVVGSDQNWRPANIAGGYYTLEFVPDDVNKIAYSTSFGISYIVPSQIEKAKSFLGRLNHISVREDTGKEIIHNLLGRDALVVCDPTILLSKEQWTNFISEKSQVDLSKIVKEPYILCYFLSENQEQRQYALRLKEKTGLRIVSVLLGEGRYYKEDKKNYDISLYSVGPLDFVNLIRKAEYICTDSFHGCAFSLIFEKQFYAFYKSKPNSKMSVNSRLDSMLGWAGVGDRIIIDTNNEIDTSKNIDYSIVCDNIEKMRTMSMNYLNKSLI